MRAKIPSFDEWLHVALVSEGPRLSLYFNGVEVDQDDFSDAMLVVDSSPFGIGKRPESSWFGFNGLIDEARICSSALSAPRDDGRVDIVVDLGPGGADLPWLRYVWPEDGNLADDPRARATFGIWEGRDQLIFVREVY